MQASVRALQSASVPQAVVRRHSLVIPAGLFGTFACLISGLVMLHPAIDFDLAWHVRTGYYILANHTIPRGDLYSFTFRGAPWVEHEWLWQVVMALIDGIGGRLGIVFFGAALMTTAMAFVYLRLRQRAVSPMFAALGPLGAMVALAHFTELRPAMIITALTSVYLFAFERYERQRDWRWLAGIVPLQIVWANCHGSYVIGLFLCSIFGAGALWDRRSALAIKPWATLFACLTLATLANPLGVGLFHFTLFASRLQFNREFLAEWRAPDFSDLTLAPVLLFIVMSLALSALGRQRHMAKHDVLLLAGATLAVLQSQQFGLLYAVAAVPLVFEMLYDRLGRPVQRPMSVLSAVTLGLLSIGICIAGPVRMLRSEAYDERIANMYPVQAVAFIEHEQLQGPMWNEFDWGAWLIGALPRLPLFVDGRTEIYGDSFLYRYEVVADGFVPPQKLFDEHAINLALIRSVAPLAAELRQDPHWQEAYKDRLASVFVRRSSYLAAYESLHEDSNAAFSRGRSITSKWATAAAGGR